MKKKAVLILLIATLLSACTSNKQFREADKRSQFTSKVIEILDKGPYTGLIIDARGLNVEMAMAPKIYAMSDRLVYGYISVIDDRWLNNGMVQYANSLENARSDLVNFIGENPLVVKGRSAKGKKRTNVVVDDTSAVAIFASDIKDHFLEQGRVVFVID